MRSYKKRFPFRIGTTSFIFPECWALNVRRLGPLFDEIELLLFESRPASMPPPSEIRELAELKRSQGTAYNVHLPTDVDLAADTASRRRQAADALHRAIERTAVLSPSTYTLHLPFHRRNDTAASWRRRWLENAREGLEALLAGGLAGPRLSIESLDYPLQWLEAAITSLDLRVCLDCGHLMRNGFDLGRAWRDYAERTVIMHLHGVRGHRDHCSLKHLSGGQALSLLTMLRRYTGVVSLEVFALEPLLASLAELERLWASRFDRDDPA